MTTEKGSLEYCIGLALEESFEGLDRKAKNNLADKIKQRYNDILTEDPSKTPADAQSELFAQIAKEKNRDAKLAEAYKLQFANTIHDKLTFIDNANEMDESKPLIAQIASLPSKGKPWAKGMGKSTNLAGKTLAFQRLGRFDTELKQLKVDKQWQSRSWRKKYEGDVLEEIRNPGGSKNPDAALIGKTAKKYFKETVVGMQEAGLPIKDVEEFMSTYHRDPERMLQVEDTPLKSLKYRAQPGRIFNYKEDYEKSYKRWRDTELKFLNKDKTFGANANNDAEIDKFMRHAYDHQVIYKANASANEKDAFVFKGLAKITARKTKMFYKHGWAFAEANKAYGRGDAGHLIQHTLEAGAKMEVAAKHWTPQVYKAFSKVKDILMERIHDKPAHLRQKLTDNLNFAERVLDEVTGLAKVPVNATSAKYTNSVLCYESMKSFGGSLLRAVNDIAGWQTNLFQSGHGYFKSFVTPYLHLAKRLTGIETTAKDLKDLGNWHKGITGDVSSRFASCDSFNGLQARAMGIFFNANLIHPLDNLLKGGSIRDFCRELWRHSKTSFDKLHPDFQFTLKRYNINEPEWDLIRNHSFKLPDNRRLITPDDPFNYSKEEIATFLGKKDITSKEFKDGQLDISQRMGAMMTDRVHMIYLDTDPIEQAKLRMGTRPGTTMGNLNRLIVQAHAWPVGIYHRILGSILSNMVEGEGALGKLRGLKKDLPGLAFYVAGVHVTSFLSQSLINAVQLKKPPKFFSLESEKNAFSEMTGILGQVLASILSKNTYGNDPLISSTGPAIRDADDVVKIISKAWNHQKYGLSLYKLIKRGIPPLNLFYVKPFFNYLIGYAIQEHLFPGSIRRALLNHQKRVRNDGEAGYFIPPTSALGV